MVSKHVIVMIWFLILVAGMVGFAWTQWSSSNPDASTDERYDQSIYKNLDPSFSREHQRGRLMSAARKILDSAGLSFPSGGPFSTSTSSKTRTTLKNGRKPDRPLKNYSTPSRA